jgi:hypothetical protein
MRKKTSASPGQQHQDFVKAARELGADESEEAFDKVLKRIASAPPPKSVHRRKHKPQRRQSRKENS